MHEKNKGEGKVFFIRKLCLILELPLLLLQNCHVYISRYRCRSRYKGRIRFIRYKRSRYSCRGRYSVGSDSFVEAGTGVDAGTSVASDSVFFI